MVTAIENRVNSLNEPFLNVPHSQENLLPAEKLSMDLLTKIQDRTAVVAVIGLGYVGLPLATTCAEVGFTVNGIDLSEDKVAGLNRGESHIQDVPNEQLASLVSSSRLRAHTGYDSVADADIVIMCVPTPLNKTGDPDISYILAAGNALRDRLKSGALVVLESTTFPGTTEELLAPMLVEAGLTVGHDLFVAFSPERIDPGNPHFGLRNVPKVVGGMTPACRTVAVAFYEAIVEQVVPVSSPIAAEMTKLLENTFRSVNIALVNEVAIMCSKLGVDVWEVIEAAASKPYGFMKFSPGPGVGGHCIPVDPNYLSWKLKHLNYNARFVQLAGEINAEMPTYVVGKVVDALNAQRKAVNGSRILVLGVAYKPDVDDVRESPALDILRLLHARGAELFYNDPYVAQLKLNGVTLESQPLTSALLAAQDCVVIVTAHKDYDWASITSAAKVIVDTRNVIHTGTTERATVIRL
jgi:UDP-N-acetyl-D-glucosamine dehydrogenase